MNALPGIISIRKPDAVLILGDLTTSKDFHPSRLVNQIVSEIAAIAAICPLGILMGNHDYLNEGWPFFEFVNHIPNVEWIGSAREGRSLKHDKLRAIFVDDLFLPHTRNYAADWAAFIKAGFKGYRNIFAHNTFSGADAGHGKALEGIPTSIFPKNAQIISGDVHIPQSFGQITYVGAQYLINFGDDYAPRMIMLEDRAIKSISLKSWPQKRLITTSSIAKLPKNLNPGDTVKVRMEMSELSDWPEQHQKILQWAQKHDLHLFRAEPTLLNKVVRKNIRVKASDALGVPEAIKQYGKRHNLDEKIISEGLELAK